MLSIFYSQILFNAIDVCVCFKWENKNVSNKINQIILKWNDTLGLIFILKNHQLHGLFANGWTLATDAPNQKVKLLQVVKAMIKQDFPILEYETPKIFHNCTLHKTYKNIRKWRQNN